MKDLLWVLVIIFVLTNIEECRNNEEKQKTKCEIEVHKYKKSVLIYAKQSKNYDIDIDKIDSIYNTLNK